MRFPLDEADKAKQEAAATAAAPLLERTRKLLGDRVGDVRISARLTDSPSCLALADFDLAPHLARLLREAGQDVPESKAVLELNPEHPLVKRLAGERRCEGWRYRGAIARAGGDHPLARSLPILRRSCSG